MSKISGPRLFTHTKPPIDRANDILDHAQLNHGMSPMLRNHLRWLIVEQFNLDVSYLTHLKLAVQDAMKGLEVIKKEVKK